MKKSIFILAAATVVLATTLGFSVTSSKQKSVEQETAAQEPAMIKPKVHEAQF